MIGFSLSFLGCLEVASKDSDSVSDVGELTVNLIDQAKIQDELSQQVSAVDPSLGGIYFGELEIVAYSYRPGEKIQTGNDPNGFNGADWSYWILLLGGHDEAREIVLKPDDDFKVSAPKAEHRFPMNKEYVSKVGEFSIDFFEVAVYRPGIVYNNAYYGPGNILNPDPLFKHPEWAGIPRYLSAAPGIGGFAGFPGHGNGSDVTQRITVFSVLFARDDWFPEPVLVYFWNRTQMAASSKPLSTYQTSVLTSLVSQNTQRRYMDHLIIVPYSHRTLALKKEKLNRSDVRPSSEARVSFDFSDVLEAGSVFAGNSSVIKFKRDASDVPLGIGLSFTDKRKK